VIPACPNEFQEKIFLPSNSSQCLLSLSLCLNDILITHIACLNNGKIRCQIAIMKQLMLESKVHLQTGTK
jgi:hypothetical protein